MILEMPTSPVTIIITKADFIAYNHVTSATVTQHPLKIAIDYRIDL